jgi:hypothetical protein
MTAETTWLQRSTAPGVLFATDFSRDEDVLPHRYANAKNEAQFGMVHRAVDEGVPCLQIDIRANNPGGTTQGQAWRRRFSDAWANDGDGIGTQPFWIQFGFKIPASRLVPWSTVIGGDGRKVEYNSWKFAIIANLSVSNPWGMADQSSNAISHVLTNKSHRGHQFPITYAHNNRLTNGEPFEVPIDNGQDIDLSHGWVAPNGGLCRYSDSSNCPIWPVEKWIWFQYRQHTRTYGGTAGNELDLWWAIDGDTKWTPLVTRRDYLVGNQPVPWANGFNAIWLTGFETDRQTVAGVDSWMRYRHLIIATHEIPFPGEQRMASIKIYLAPGDPDPEIIHGDPADQSALVAALRAEITALRAAIAQMQDAATADGAADDANKAGAGVLAVPIPPTTP